MYVEESFDYPFILLGQDLQDKALLPAVPKIALEYDHQRQFYIEVPPLKP